MGKKRIAAFKCRELMAAVPNTCECHIGLFGRNLLYCVAAVLNAELGRRSRWRR